MEFIKYLIRHAASLILLPKYILPIFCHQHLLGIFPRYSACKSLCLCHPYCYNAAIIYLCNIVSLPAHNQKPIFQRVTYAHQRKMLGELKGQKEKLGNYQQGEYLDVGPHLYPVLAGKMRTSVSKFLYLKIVLNFSRLPI